MATELELGGTYAWEMEEDEDGHRQYKIQFLVRSDFTDGPFNVRNTAGLPLPGAIWNFFDDRDQWAWCLPTKTVRPYFKRDGEKGKHWIVECHFSTDPRKEKCFELEVEDPLLEPPKLSGRSVRFMEPVHHALEVSYRRAGVELNTFENSPILNSAHERLQGNLVEFEKSYSSVRIEMNVPFLRFAFLQEMVDSVNDDILWGVPRRCVKFSGFSWERRFYGDVTDSYTGTGTDQGPQVSPTGTGTGTAHCNRYYVWILDFEVKVVFDPDTDEAISGHDRIIADEGTKVLNGEYDTDGDFVVHEFPNYEGSPNPDPDNPSHFIRYRDKNGNLTRVILNGEGLPCETLIATECGTGTNFPSGEHGDIYIKHYPERNLLLLGIPADLETA